MNGCHVHGYQIIHLIKEQSSGRWRPTAGSAYPAAQLLEDEGLVQAEQRVSTEPVWRLDNCPSPLFPCGHGLPHGHGRDRVHA